MPLLLPEFRACVLRAPAHPALREGGRDVSYLELDRRSAAIAALLKARGLCPGGVVGLRLPRCGAYVAAMLAAARAGGVALPLDPSLPRERLAAIRAVAPPALEIALEDDDDDAGEADLRLDPFAEGCEAAVEPDEQQQQQHHHQHQHQQEQQQEQEQDPDAPMLLSFTSGSTGTPKGVMLSAGNVAAGARAWRSDCPEAAGGRSLMAGAPGFIVAFIEMSMALSEGSTLVIAREAERRDPAALLDLIARERVTRALVPTSLALAVAEAACAGGRRTTGGEAARAEPPQLAVRHWMLGSEPLHVTPALRAFALGPCRGAVFVNTYGSTEAGPVARFVLPRDPADWPATPPIGSPWGEVRVAVLDAQGQPIIAGGSSGGKRSGELVVAGPSVALGYWKDPERTAERFPSGVAGLPAPPARAFRTGDTVRRVGADDQLHWVGRVDDQIKASGYRIEPAEVEAVLLEHPAVAEAAVAAQPDAAGRPRLVALVVPRDCGGRRGGGGGGGRGASGASTTTMPPPGELARHLSARLPAYMVPALFCQVAALPRLPGGKLDRRALPKAVALPALGAGSNGRGAETPTERALASCVAALLELESKAVPMERDLFELGLDSVRALQLSAAVEARCGFCLPTADIFEARTVAAMAARLQDKKSGGGDPAAQKAAATAPTRLLPLTAAAARPGAPALVLVHPAGGMVFNFVPIALALPEMRCLGLQARGVEAGEAPDRDFDAMVDRYAEAVRAAVWPPDGDDDGGDDKNGGRAPLRIAGYSFGGVIAHELMRRLRPTPGPDDLLVLIDPVKPSSSSTGGRVGGEAAVAPPRSLDDVLMLALKPIFPRVARCVRPLLPLLPRRAKLALGRCGIARFLAASPEALAFQRLSTKVVERIVAVWIAFSEMHTSVRCCRKYPVRAVLLTASERARRVGGEEEGGGVQQQTGSPWEELVGEVVLRRDLPGNHFTMLSVGNVPNVVAAIREGLGLVGGLGRE